MEKQRIMLALTDEAIELLKKNTTERKRGQAASQAILAYYAAQRQQDKLPIEGGILERVEQLLVRVAAKL